MKKTVKKAPPADPIISKTEATRLVKCITPAHRASAIRSIQVHNERVVTPKDIPDTPPELPAIIPDVYVFMNNHRHSCIRVLTGRKKTHYITMEGNGVSMEVCSNENFKMDWRPWAGNTPQQTAKIYLNSFVAAHYISETARTHLEEISNTGATTQTTKEIDMTQASAQTTKTSKATKPSLKASKAATTKPSKAVVTKPAGKPTATAAKPAAKPSAKAAKPTAKAAKPSAKATKPSGYAGMKITPLFKEAEVAAREGTWTRFMICAALRSSTAEGAQKIVDANKDYAGRKMDFGWLVAKGYIAMK